MHRMQCGIASRGVGWDGWVERVSERASVAALPREWKRPETTRKPFARPLKPTVRPASWATTGGSASQRPRQLRFTCPVGRRVCSTAARPIYSRRRRVSPSPTLTCPNLTIVWDHPEMMSAKLFDLVKIYLHGRTHSSYVTMPSSFRADIPSGWSPWSLAGSPNPLLSTEGGTRTTPTSALCSLAPKVNRGWGGRRKAECERGARKRTTSKIMRRSKCECSWQ